MEVIAAVLMDSRIEFDFYIPLWEYYSYLWAVGCMVLFKIVSDRLLFEEY